MWDRGKNGKGGAFICYRSYLFQPEQQQLGGALIMDRLDGDGDERVGREEGVGVAVEGRVGRSETFNLLRTCLPWAAVAGGGILEGPIIAIFSTFSV